MGSPDPGSEDPPLIVPQNTAETSPASSGASSGSTANGVSSSSSSSPSSSSPSLSYWKWVVAAAAFTGQFVSGGILYSYGVLLLGFKDRFDCGETTAAWVGSIEAFLCKFSGVLAEPLLKKFGFRVLAIVGSVLACLGYVLSAFVTDAYMLFLTYGVLVGLGCGGMYYSSVVVVAAYFEKNRSIATGIMAAGSPAGITALAFFMDSMLREFDMQMTLFGMAGFSLLGIACGAVYCHNIDELLGQRENKTSNRKQNSHGEETSSLNNSESPNYGSLPSTPNGPPTLNGPAGTKQRDCQIHDRCHIAKVIDLSLWKDPAFVTVSMALFCLYSASLIIYDFVPEKALIYGVRPGTMVGIMGTTNFVMRLVSSCIAGRGAACSLAAAGGGLLVLGVSTILMPLYRNEYLLMMYALLCGSAMGLSTALHYSVVTLLTGIDVVERATGQSFAFGAIAYLVAPPFAGWLIEAFDIDTAFIATGCISLVGAVAYFTALLLRYCQGQAKYQDLHENDIISN